MKNTLLSKTQKSNAPGNAPLLENIKKIPLNIPKIGEVRFPIALFDAPEVGEVAEKYVL